MPYTVLQLITHVPEGGDFIDEGTAKTSFYVKDAPSREAAIDAARLYFLMTEARIVKIGVDCRLLSAPTNVFAHVSDVSGKFIQPEER